MRQYKKNFELKNMAKDRMEGKYGGAILLFLLNALISGMVQLSISTVAGSTMDNIYAMTGSAEASAGISFLFDLVLLAASAVLGVMNAGIALYFLNIACRQPAAVRNLFCAFRADSTKALLISGAMALCQAVCFWPGQYLAQHYVDTGDILWAAAALSALAVGLCVYVPISLGISMSFYLMLDFPQNSGRETLALCWRVMRGHRRRLFSLELGFIPLMVLCIFSFGIGFLWLMPYMHMTYTCFFLDLMNPAET